MSDLRANLAAEILRHGDSGRATWANERICICGTSYRTMMPPPLFADHLADVLLSLPDISITSLSSDASASASDERPGRSVAIPRDVDRPGLPNISDTTIAQACERIDILEQEVEALQRENARLRRELGW